VDRPLVAWGEVTLDCRDTAVVSSFWAALFGVEASPTQPDGWYTLGPMVKGGPLINFQPVPEKKQGKARMHLDVWVDDLDRAISLVERLGGRDTGERHKYESGTVEVMADPEGNEFCLVASAKP